MISPNIITIRRIRKAGLLRRRSIRDISRDYFKSEHPWILAVESAVFAILVVIALWPILHAAAIMRAYPL